MYNNLNQKSARNGKAGFDPDSLLISSLFLIPNLSKVD